MFDVIPDGIVDCKRVRLVSRGFYVQRKNSRNRLLNFIYRILFGNEFVYAIKTGDVYMVDNCLYMNPVTFEELKSRIWSVRKIESLKSS